MTHARKDGITDLNVKDEARTPPYLFEQLNARFGITGDVAASEYNHLCLMYFTKERDALKQDEWFRVSFGNPPYSRGMIDAFLKKGYEESLKDKIVIFLLPADLSTMWFRKYCMLAAEWLIVEGRVKFNDPDGNQMPGTPQFGSIVVVFDEERRKKDGLKVGLIKWH